MTTSMRISGRGSESGRDTLTPPRQIHAFVVAGLVIANILVFLLSGDSLYRSRQSYEQRAETLTKNIASALDVNISRGVDKIDLSLRSVVDELERQLAGKGIDESAMKAFLSRSEERLPELEAFRVARADGLVILGKGLDKSKGVSWADRDYFTFLRDHPESGLQIAPPRIGRVAKQYIVGFARRFNYPDGRFAGVVSAPITLSYFSQILEQMNLGPKGSIILRNENLGLITRVPPLPNTPAGQVGNAEVSGNFRKIYDSGVPTDTYSTPSGADGLARVATFHRLTEARMVVIVALAKEDYLADWNREAYRTLAMSGSFMLLSLFLSYLLLRSLKQTENNRQQLSASEAFVHDVINSLSQHVAVIDGHGEIIEVNSAWQHFASNSGIVDSTQVAVGANYFEICNKASNSPEASDALMVADGLRSLLDGSSQEFTIEYQCHSPTEKRWFVLHAVPLHGLLMGAVLIHQNVTERKKLELSQKNAKQQLEDQLIEISALQTRLQEQAIRDPLTGLYNRRYVDETLSRDLSLAKREGYPVTLVMLDLDHFKRVNDTYGHAAGDMVLTTLSTFLMEGARQSDMICRYGGEEFLIAFPRMSIEQALQRVESWRLRLAETQIIFGEFTIHATFSAGISGYPQHGADIGTLMACADEALYSSKHRGRNRVTCFVSEKSAANKDCPK